MSPKMNWVERCAVKVLARYVWKQEINTKLTGIELQLGELEVLNRKLAARLAESGAEIAAMLPSR